VTSPVVTAYADDAADLLGNLAPLALVVPGLFMQAAGFAWIVHLAGSAAGYGSFVVPFVVAGVGISMTLPCLPAAGLNSVAPHWLGKASGVLNMSQLLGATVGVAVATIVFDAHGGLGSAAQTTSGYRAALAVAAGCSVIGAVLGLGLRRRAAPEKSRPQTAWQTVG